jgi:tartrate-resistant acid phosphatase type 5
MKKTTLLLFLSIAARYAYAQTPLSVNVPADSITFAVIGDYGQNSEEEGQVAAMVKTWGVDFIITTGDNNYTWGKRSTLKKNITKYYGDFIYNPDAPADLQCHGKAAQDKVNRFFPSPGNHDNYSKGMKPYLEYFTLPGDEKNYDFTWGPVEFFSMDTKKEADIDCCESPESKWLQGELAKSTAPFKFVYFHHPPYSPGEHGNATHMQWPYGKWGVDAVLCGHEHFYARIIDKTAEKPIYFICGSSGNTHLYGCNEHPLDSARFKVSCDHMHWGAMKVKATAHMVVFEYYIATEPERPIDTYIIRK